MPRNPITVTMIENNTATTGMLFRIFCAGLTVRNRIGTETCIARIRRRIPRTHHKILMIMKQVSLMDFLMDLKSC